MTLHSTHANHSIWRAGRRSWAVTLPGEAPTAFTPWWTSLARAKQHAERMAHL